VEDLRPLQTLVAALPRNYRRGRATIPTSRPHSALCFSTRNFERLIIDTCLIFPHTFVITSNLKIGPEVPKASGKLFLKWRWGGVTDAMLLA